MDKYILYARKSTDDEERQILSISAQTTEVQEFAVRENIEIVEILTESKTAKIPGRPVFNQMLKSIEDGKASGIITWHPDRLARNAVDAGQIIHLLDTGKLLDLKFPSFWFQNSPQGVFMLNMAFGQSKYYVDALSENTKRGLREKIRNGIFPSWAPLGYLNDKNTKTIVLDPEKSKIVIELFNIYSKGIYTFDSMSNFLFQKGIRARGGTPYHKSVMKMILQNPFYYGYFRYGGEIHEGKHQPLITKKLWDKVQEVIAGRCWHRKVNHHYPFTGLMHCGECGYMITAENKIKHYKKWTQEFIYYRCSKKNPKQKCFQPFVREHVITAALRRKIKSFAMPSGWTEYFLQEIKKEKLTDKNETGIFVKDKEIERQEVGNKINHLLDMHLDATITREEFLKKKGQLLAKKKNIEEEMFSAQTAKNSWLELIKRYTLLCQEAETIPTTQPYYSGMTDFLKRTGSDLTLKDGKVGGGWPKMQPLLLQRPPSRDPAAGLGFEPKYHPSEGRVLPLDDPAICHNYTMSAALIYFIYILRTSKNTLYVGQTNNLEKRLLEHKTKKARGAKYMKYFTDFKLIYAEEFKTRSEAMKREYAIKQLTKQQKEALVYNN